MGSVCFDSAVFERVWKILVSGNNEIENLLAGFAVDLQPERIPVKWNINRKECSFLRAVSSWLQANFNAELKWPFKNIYASRGLDGCQSRTGLFYLSAIVYLLATSLVLQCWKVVSSCTVAKRLWLCLCHCRRQVFILRKPSQQLIALSVIWTFQDRKNSRNISFNFLLLGSGISSASYVLCKQAQIYTGSTTEKSSCWVIGIWSQVQFLQSMR